MSANHPPSRKRASRIRRTEGPHTLYRFFDSDGRLLYIGVTGTPRSRWSHHSKNKAEWRRVATITVQHLDSREELEAAEKAAIKAERPLWNKTHNQPSRTVAEVRALLDQGEWLSVDDIAILFGTSRGVAAAWVTRGTKLLAGARPERRKQHNTVEVDPRWVSSLLVECRKVRSFEHPDGIPGQFIDLRHW